MVDMKSNKNVTEAIINIGNDPKLLHEFLVDILTPGEYSEINKRWEIVKMIHAGIPQHDIAKKLGVGIATVTRGSRTLKNNKGAFAKLLK
jgi:TrpR family trp operon transcriptional repressor